MLLPQNMSMRINIQLKAKWKMRFKSQKSVAKILSHSIGSKLKKRFCSDSEILF